MSVAAIVFNCSVIAKNESAKAEWLEALIAAKSEFGSPIHTFGSLLSAF